jgi:hypothetical protein
MRKFGARVSLSTVRTAVWAFSFLILAVGASAADVGRFVSTGDMTVGRVWHTATLLADGRVLITGGGSATAEIYDPSSGRFTPTGSMHSARDKHSATLFRDGSVLIVGGEGLYTAEIYHPETGTFSLAGSLLEDQFGHTATLLADGRVLVAGGERSASPWPTSARAELYDPVAGTFSFAASYASNGGLYAVGGPVWPTATTLSDGRVLIAGQDPAELYDPATASFIPTGAAFNADWHAATLLRDGNVLITGGSDDMSCGGSSAARLYDASSNRFDAIGDMAVARDIHTSTLLLDGRVLIAGGGDGWCSSPLHATAELYVPASRSFISTATMTTARSGHTATLLRDGRVLMAGGQAAWPGTALKTAELYMAAADHRHLRSVSH